jgi:hypothetical protein
MGGLETLATAMAVLAQASQPTVTQEVAPWVTAVATIGNLGFSVWLAARLVVKQIPERDKLFTDSLERMSAADKDAQEARDKLLGAALEKVTASHERLIKEERAAGEARLDRLMEKIDKLAEKWESGHLAMRKLNHSLRNYLQTRANERHLAESQSAQQRPPKEGKP